MNTNCVLGDGTSTTQTDPTLVTAVTAVNQNYTITSITQGYYHTCVMTSNCEVLCWGLNSCVQ